MDISGMQAIVTGGASGLGAATARALAAKGASTFILDANVGLGEAVAEDIGGTFVPVDVTSEDSVERALDICSQNEGPARILVNCAGVAPTVRIVAKDGTPHPITQYRRAIEVNLIGSFLMMSRFAARLIAARVDSDEAGIIVNTASVAAFDGQIGQAAYASSKGGVVGLTLSAARDLAQHRIRVMTIAPGIFLTPMLEGLPEAVQESLGTQVPHPSRLGRPNEYAQLVIAIVENSMLNGETIRLDGAIRMAPR